MEVLREITEAANDKRAVTVQAEVSLEILNFIVNNKRDELSKLEKELDIIFKLIGNNQFRGKECKILAFDNKSNILGKNKNTREKKVRNKNQNTKSKKALKNSKTNSSKNENKINVNGGSKEKKAKNFEKVEQNQGIHVNVSKDEKKPSKEKKEKDKKLKKEKNINEIDQTEEIKNENYIGAPISEGHDYKKKKTGWWNK